MQSTRITKSILTRIQRRILRISSSSPFLLRQNKQQQQQCRYILSDAVTRQVKIKVDRHGAILEDINENPDQAFEFGKELSSLSHIVSLNEKFTNLDEEEASLQELLSEASELDDQDMKEECQQELETLEVTREKLERRIRDAILPQDETDYVGDAILEIRAGTGGDEATLFASELRETYEKSAKSMKWSFEVLSETRTDLGGIKETVLSIAGRGGGGNNMYAADDDDEEEDFRSTIGPYGLFKYESGVHRVQRVPVNDTRIHTSACSVAALPLLQDSGNSNELLPMSELKIETMRSSGAGGQHVNTTDSAVRITHIPTGITASIQDARSQHKNKDKALKLIAARVRDQQRQEEERKLGATRSSLLGSGDRSERIRTYNYPQDRVTDHRCKHTTHGISKLLDGSSSDGLVVTFYPYLRDMVREEQLAALEEEQE